MSELTRTSALAARHTLKWPFQIFGYPAAIKAALLSYYPLIIHKAFVYA